MCEDAALVLTDAGAAPEQLRGRTVRLGPRPCGAPGGAAPGALSLPEPGDVCMVVYTSGSTGRPKGAVCDHRNLWHSVLCFGSSIGVSSESRLLWKTPYQWRTAEYELYPALCAGGSLCVAAEGAHKRPDYIAKVLGDFGVHALVTVPTVLDMLLGHLDGAGALAHVAAVGEPLPSRACRGFLRGGGPVLQNFYGLTETGMTVWRCDREPAGATAPAGRPQPGVRVCVLRGGGLLAASPLEEGEIFFGGIMALGYLVGGALSEDHFVPAPPASGLGAGARLFRSGDLGRWNDRGELEVMGRVDRQVKLHGVRVELQEIEAQLVEGRLCREAAVVPAREDPQTLVAFLVGAPGGCSEELGSALAERVPAYMVPPHFVSLPALPRLLNDKIDRDALRAHTVGLVTRAQAKRMLEDSLSAGGEASAALVHFVDSLGFQRAVQQSEFAQRRLLDNLLAFGMLNVILFHWYWYVLVVPRTYLTPWDEHRPGETVSLPPLPVASWVTFTYRMLTQEWVNGAFIIVAVHEQSPAELKRFTLRDAAVIMLYFYVASIPTLLSLFVPAPWNEYILSAETIQRWFLLVLALGKSYI
ncbi:unnamed protein product [Prorocentrum cordatum]|uniref:AMP-dependent synthetase/ligase domain-containing protein n=1 Tax=Prorocentrum cordatum TaxID=2364126 RepID=A0ABN9PUY4_9DINO|nr:unnamed protein product [Polarella glacialis]